MASPHRFLAEGDRPHRPHGVGARDDGSKRQHETAALVVNDGMMEMEPPGGGQLGDGSV